MRYLIYVPQAGLVGKENIFVQESLSVIHKDIEHIKIHK